MFTIMYGMCFLFGILLVSNAFARNQCTNGTKVGKTAGDRTDSISIGTTFLLNSKDNEYRMNCSGFLIEWDIRIASTGVLYAEVWRQVTGIWTLIGVNKINVPAGDVGILKNEVVPLADQIAVESGDYLAFKSSGNTIVEFIRTNNGVGSSNDQIQFSTTAAHTVSSTSNFTAYTTEPNIEFGIRATLAPACSVGLYGENCALNCNEHCIGCNRINGICDNGCIPGWKGEFCDEECKRGFYGKDCNLQCGNCHESAQCHLENGSCLNGCSAGYKGLLCNKVCSFGLYGANCEQECSLFCKKSLVCHHVSGICLGGCKTGWKGHRCWKDTDEEQIVDVIEDLRIQFYCVLGICCFLVILLGVFTLYIKFKRNTGIKEKSRIHLSGSTLQEKEEGTTCISVVDDGKKFGTEYQEIGDLSPPSNYDLPT
ncbi:delta and Notch-like epidermal growth factor-related receptor [Saccostrea cucullata]|uniref:delta and Notch-like epidermal growth factor-related receptor n=1 Tax=Saccostrea cuccullata TaxID=36930 RepID=UPI002ED6BF17